MRARAGLDQAFAWWLLHSVSPVLQSKAVGSTFEAVTADDVRSETVNLPSSSDQRRIADFLDRKTAEIDALIAKKERMVALLHEKRQADITRLITKGLDPNAKLKASGNQWLGAIPYHWQLKPLKHLTPDARPIMYGIVLPGPHVEGGIPIVKGGNCEPGRLRLELLSRTTPEIEAAYVRSRLIAGDIVYAIRGSIGAADMVPPEVEGANLTQDAARIAPRHGVNGQWLLHAVRSTAFFGQLDARATGATIRGINIFDLKRGIVPVPPAREQAEIAENLDRYAEWHTLGVSRLERSIALLAEYRRALISEAVAGRVGPSEVAKGVMPSRARESMSC